MDTATIKRVTSFIYGARVISPLRVLGLDGRAMRLTGLVWFNTAERLQAVQTWAEMADPMAWALVDKAPDRYDWLHLEVTTTSGLPQLTMVKPGMALVFSPRWGFLAAPLDDSR